MTLLIVDNIVKAIKNICQGIWDTLVNIGNGINQIFNFIKDLIEDTLNVLKYILDGFRLIGQAINLLPDFIKFMAVILIAVYVAFQILGRESGAKH